MGLTKSLKYAVKDVNDSELKKKILFHAWSFFLACFLMILLCVLNLFKRGPIPFFKLYKDSPGQCLMGICLENVIKEEGECE